MEWWEILFSTVIVFFIVVHIVLIGKSMYLKWVKRYHYLDISSGFDKLVAIILFLVCVGNFTACINSMVSIQDSKACFLRTVLMLEYLYLKLVHILTFENDEFIFIQNRKLEKSETYIINGEDKHNIVQLKCNKIQIGIWVSSRGKQRLYERLNVMK